jgi:hypothetical protein
VEDVSEEIFHFPYIICHFSFEDGAWLEIWNSNLEIAEGSAMKNGK